MVEDQGSLARDHDTEWNYGALLRQLLARQRYSRNRQNPRRASRLTRGGGLSELTCDRTCSQLGAEPDTTLAGYSRT